ncbi:MAG: hypothetical protein AAB091_05260, partial [Elusimicrobiota bacterium]
RRYIDLGLPMPSETRYGRSYSYDQISDTKEWMGDYRRFHLSRLNYLMADNLRGRLARHIVAATKLFQTIFFNPEPPCRPGPHGNC